MNTYDPTECACCGAEPEGCPNCGEMDKEVFRERVEAAVSEAFSGDEFEENAAAAAGEGEWSWFHWLALAAVRAVRPKEDD